MVEANLKIIAELKLFLEEVASNKEVRELISIGKDAFTRDRKLPLKRLVGILINMPKRSLSVEIHDFFDSLEKSSEECSKTALSLQRGKLEPLFFKVWNKWLVDSFYYHYGDAVKRWRSFIIQAVDGSTAYLLNKPDIVKHFGTQSNQYSSIPMARIMQVQDVLNDITVWGDIFPIARSERSIIADQVHNLAPDSITLFDRGYPGYGLMYLMLNEEIPRHFVMRCRANFNKEVTQFSHSQKRSKIIYFSPDEKGIAMLAEHGYRVNKKTTLKMRMVKITLPGGEEEILLTSLYDEQLYSIEDLYYLYGLRWRIETTYNKQKNQQQMEQFSGHRVICIQQDYAAGLFTANLQSLVEKQCENYLQKINSKRKYRYRINRNVSWAAIKHNIVKLFLENKPLAILRTLQAEFEKHIEPIRPGRKYVRVKKLKKLNGKFQTYSNHKRAI